MNQSYNRNSDSNRYIYKYVQRQWMDIIINIIIMFKTLDDYKKDKDKGQNGKKTESYTGGGKSGMAVENNDLENIVNQARQ